ncbi:MAG TPA: nucleotidyltransferase family protein [Acidimicrobiales bacterium]|nr:nucleotidyltransferase family protein [Acidimicrobiales bacterium]
MTGPAAQDPTGGAALARVLRACLAWERDEPAAGASWPAGISLQDAVEAHRVGPVLAPWRDRLGLTASDEAWLEAKQRRNTTVALAASRQLVELVAALDAAGIRVLTLKGIPLALRTTGNLAGRHCGDIDLLVDTADLAAADGVMRDLGYHTSVGPAASPLADPCRRLVLTMNNQLVFSAPGRQPVEIHWRLTKHELLPLPFDEAWAARTSMAVAGADVAILGDEHERLFVTVHAAKHHFMRMKWLVDVTRLLTDVDAASWVATCALAHRLGLAVTVEGSRAMAARLAPRRVQRVVGLSSSERRRAARLTTLMWSTCLRGEEGRLDRRFHALRMRRGLRYRAGVVGSAFPLRLLDTGASSLLLPFRRVPGWAQRMVERATTSR